MKNASSSEPLPLDHLYEFNDYLHTKISLPASLIIEAERNIEKKLFLREELLLCYKLVIQTIQSCLSKNYSNFDAHTTANCCHGMALLVRELILKILDLDLEALLEEGYYKIKNLEKSKNVGETCQWYIPSPLLELARLYTITFIKEIDPQRGARTRTTHLKRIVPISKNLCDKIVHNLQKRFSNLVASRYFHYFSELKKDFKISLASIEEWGKYVHPDFLRKDKRGVQYAPCLFSMQISLAHLISTGSKIAIVNDMMTSSGVLQGRYFRIFESDGENFRPLSNKEMKFIRNKSEPVVVFGGCVYSDFLDIDSLTLQMNRWIHEVSHLILACDIHYPHYPKISDDPDFNSTPIVPEEQSLVDAISYCSKIQGVSSSDPSLFCLTHICTSSMEQIKTISKNHMDETVPRFFIPDNKASLALQA